MKHPCWIFYYGKCAQAKPHKIHIQRHRHRDSDRTDIQYSFRRAQNRYWLWNCGLKQRLTYRLSSGFGKVQKKRQTSSEKPLFFISIGCRFRFDPQKASNSMPFECRFWNSSKVNMNTTSLRNMPKNRNPLCHRNDRSRNGWGQGVGEGLRPPQINNRRDGPPLPSATCKLCLLKMGFTRFPSQSRVPAFSFYCFKCLFPLPISVALAELYTSSLWYWILWPVRRRVSPHRSPSSFVI